MNGRSFTDNLWDCHWHFLHLRVTFSSSPDPVDVASIILGRASWFIQYGKTIPKGRSGVECHAMHLERMMLSSLWTRTTGECMRRGASPAKEVPAAHVNDSQSMSNVMANFANGKHVLPCRVPVPANATNPLKLWLREMGQGRLSKHLCSCPLTFLQGSSSPRNGRPDGRPVHMR